MDQMHEADMSAMLQQQLLQQQMLQMQQQHLQQQAPLHDPHLQQQMHQMHPQLPQQQTQPQAQVQQPPPEPMDPQQREDAAAASFLAMAEHFRNQDPPLFKAAAKCLFAATKTQCSPLVMAHCHYQLGKFLFYFTRNISTAKEHLETAHLQFKQLGIDHEEVRLKCACLIAESALALQEKDCILPLLKEEATYSRKHPPIHQKVMMLTVEVLMQMEQLNLALDIADMALVYFQDLKNTATKKTQCYFQLVKILIFARMAGKPDQLGAAVKELSEMLQHSQHEINVNDMGAFCYTIQLTYFLTTGLITHSKRCLRELQVIVQNKGKEGEVSVSSNGFTWLRKELLTGLAYVLTALWSIQAGQYDKAERYYHNSMSHLSELNAMMRKSKWGVVERGNDKLIAHLHFALHDGMAQMYLSRAKPERVLEMSNQMVRALRVVPKDLRMLEGQIHLILGFYYHFMNFPEQAEDQFKAAIITTDDVNLPVMAKLNLCLIYLFTGAEKEFYEQFEALRPSKITSASMTCQTLAMFIDGLHKYVHNRLHEAQTITLDAAGKCLDRDILRVEALNKLLYVRSIGCSKIEYAEKAKDTATKTNDVSLQAWACSMLVEHFENRAREENNPEYLSKARTFLESLRQAEEQIAINRKAAEEVPYPKFAAMLDFSAEFGVSQWHGSIY